MTGVDSAQKHCSAGLSKTEYVITADSITIILIHTLVLERAGDN